MVDDLKPRVNKVSKKEVKKMLAEKEDFILIDIRTSKEYKKAHIDGCIHIPRGILEFKMVEKIKDKLKRKSKKTIKLYSTAKKAAGRYSQLIQ